MLELERLELPIRLLPLLGGSLEIGRVTLTGPTMELETAVDGKHNWDLAGTAASADPAATEAEPTPNVQFVTLTDDIIRYRSDAGGTVTTAQIAHGRLSGTAPGAAADVVLAGELDGVATGLSGRLAQASAVLDGSLSEAGMTDLKLWLSETELSGTATQNWAGEQNRLRANLRADRLDPEPFFRLARGGPGTKAMLETPHPERAQ
jgi:uncharacterized protein involved in outer membrane biogenesis